MPNKKLYCYVVVASCFMQGVAAEISSHPLVPGEPISFVACPIVRDTKTVPCWLSDFGEARYFLGIQQDIGADWYPPQLKHKVLVEGVVGSEKVCGGVKIENIKTSVLPELSPECNTILPAEAKIEAPHSERGPGPSHELPRSGPRPVPELPQAPFSQTNFEIYFDFDGVHLVNREFATFRKAMTYAAASKAREIIVTIFRGSALLSDGTVLFESDSTLVARESGMKRWLENVDLPTRTVKKVVINKSEYTPNGREDYRSRRVTLTVIP